MNFGEGRRKPAPEQRAAIKKRLENDKRMVNAIREAFKMAPLYGPDPLLKSDEERYGGRVWTEHSRVAGSGLQLPVFEPPPR